MRFTTSHPWDFSSKMIDVIAKYPNIMKFIHLPVQSGSNHVLKLMNRKYTREMYLERVKYLKENVPDIAITTDIMVGFPNETDEDFLDTFNLMKEVEFSGAFTFIYSKRSGTVAEKMENQVDDCIKNKRVNFLLDLEKEIKAQKEGK